MRLFDVIRVFVSAAAWRATGLRSPGRALVRALASKDENVRMIAGMFLVKAGKRSEPLLQEALQRRESLPIVLTILADIGDRKFEQELQQFCEDEDPRVARAAKEALRVLTAHH